MSSRRFQRSAIPERNENEDFSLIVTTFRGFLRRDKSIISGASYSDLYCVTFMIVLQKESGGWGSGDKLYSWIIGLAEEQLDEVQKQIISTLYAGDISSFDVHKIIDNVWHDYLFSILMIKDVVLYMNRVYCRDTGKKKPHDACTDLFRKKIELVFPIQVQGRLASALLLPVHVQRSSAVQVIVNKIRDLCSVSSEDSTTIQSTSFDRRNSSEIIINADIVFKDPKSGDNVCILPSVEFVIKRHITSLLCKGSMIDKFDHDKFIKRELIREGGFGLIYSAEWDERREKVILKYVKSNSNIKKFIEEVRNFNKEMRIHQMVSDHDNIIPFYGMAQDLNNQQFAMVLQYADGGSLREYLEYNKDLTWFVKLRFAQEITKGILWIHDKKITHRDLHSNNILVHQHKIKISDFGLSEMIDHNTRSFVGGIPAYMEPQLFISNEYCLDEKSDVYSLGVLMWEISSGQPPFNFKSPEQVISLITNNKREMPIYGTPIKYVSLYRECWQQDPQLRPTTKEVFSKLESIPIDSVIELTADIDSLLNGTSNLSIEDEECDDGVKELDINDL
ncbi:unnamed protein product [Rhizophagus irregularis]|nr:unnamed protein product [Rhizophagus irregularis]